MASPACVRGLPSWVHFCLLSPPVSTFDSPRMARLVFDIETAALPIETFDEAQQEYLFREAHRITDPLAQHARKTELEQQLNLYPFTARIVCIAMLNADSQRGRVLYTCEDFAEEENQTVPVQFVPCMDEGEML